LVLGSETEKHSNFGSNDARGWDEVRQGPVYEFAASNGWLESFRTRHNIMANNLCGESADMDVTVVEDFKATVPGLIEQYDYKDIFNLDETGLFWKAVPTRSLDKEIPFVIGKSQMPRALNRRILKGIEWRSNKKAWMNQTLFLEYMNGFNSKMKSQNRKVLMFYDNCPTHLTKVSEINFSNVKVILLPKNTSAGTQPLTPELSRISSSSIVDCSLSTWFPRI
jgi:hypothetical protein